MQFPRNSRKALKYCSSHPPPQRDDLDFKPVLEHFKKMRETYKEIEQEAHEKFLADQGVRYINCVSLMEKGKGYLDD